MGIRDQVAKHLRKPTGWFGKMIGYFMNVGNTSMNRLTFDLLDIQPDDHILEIGFGNGKLISEMAQHAAFVAGVDYSETMVQEAKKRNAVFIRKGKVEVRQGEVGNIHYPEDRFDKICTVNTLYFWPRPDQDLLELKRVLKPGGHLLIVFRPKQSMIQLGASEERGFALYESADVQELLEKAGYADIQMIEKIDRSQKIVCAMARKE